MSSATLPATPRAKIGNGSSQPSTPVTGTWRHPRLDEIVRRRDASTFSERNLRKIVWNLAGLMGLWLVSKGLWNTFPTLFQPGKLFTQYSAYAYYFFQIAFVFNVIVACLPLFRTPDEVHDIALTPAQRKLLGLPPSSAPPTPGSNYITPPRYARTPTPMSNSPANRERYSQSPLSRKESPGAGSFSESPFSPGSSPLLQKAIGGLNGSRRHSYGSGSPLGPGSSLGRSVLEAPATPTPAGSKGSNITLNSKWLYEKGRRNSGNVKLFS